MKKRISNLNALLAEKKELQSRCKAKEEVINQHLHYIQNNVGSILIQSIFPFKQPAADSTSGILDIANRFIVDALPSIGLDKEKTGKILKVVQMAVAGFVYKKVKLFFEKKTKTVNE